MSSPEPTITGELEATPLLHVLVNAHQRSLTGTLAIWPETGERGQDRVYIEGGVPVSARLLHATSPVLERALLELMARTAGAFAFYEGHDLVGEQAMRGRIEPFALFAASLRTDVRPAAMAAVLGAYAEASLRLKPGAELRRYALLPKEERLLEVARAGPSTIEELCSSSELGTELAERLVYLLIITRSLEPYDAGATRTPTPPHRAATPAAGVPRPPSDPARPASSPSPARSRSSSPPGRGSDLPPQGLSAEALAFFVEAKQRVKQLDAQNYFEMMGIARDAGTDTIRKQYLQLAKRWHPDRLAPELAVLRPDVEQLFQWMTAAHDTLVDDAKRAAHLRQIQDGGGTPEADRKLAAIVNAAMEHQKAEVLIKRRDFSGARALLERAIAMGTEDADVHATYAWTLFNLEDSEQHLPTMLSHIDTALSIAPTHDRAHFYKALTMRRLGRETDAIKHFRLASEANPRNLDALREVRLARMRGQLSRGSDPPPPGGAKSGKEEGLLSKLFGSSKKKT